MSRRRSALTCVAGLAAAWLAAFPAGAAGAPPQSAPPAAQVPAAGPALWVIRDADSTVYLFGTVHMLRPDTAWQTPRIMAAFDASTDIWFEVDEAAADNSSSLVVAHGLSSGRSLSNRLSADERRALAEAAGRAGLTPDQVETFRPWLAGLTLGNAPMAAAGYDGAFGVESGLRERAAAGGKTLRGLETMEDQVRYLAALPEETELDLLRYMIQPPQVLVADLDASVAAWLVGDSAGVEQAATLAMRRQSEALYQALMVRRSVLLADHVQTVLEGSGVAFVALGAGYLAGDDSVGSVLEDRGIKVEAAP